MIIKILKSPLPYGQTHDKMEALVADIVAGKEQEQIWFLESEAVYTAGTSARAEDLKNSKFPVFNVGRGGQYTYHGPGQRVIYLMLELKKYYPTPDIKKFVFDLEQWVIDSLAEVGVEAFRREGRVGIWVKKRTEELKNLGTEEKIAAIGIRVRKGISFHGISININPQLADFDGIVPCGIAEFGVTSLHALGKKISMSEFDEVLIKHCPFIKI